MSHNEHRPTRSAPKQYAPTIIVQKYAHFNTEGEVQIDTTQMIQRIKAWRNRHGVTLLEARQKIQQMMLVEMLDQAETMTEVKRVLQWAKFNLYPSSDQLDPGETGRRPELRDILPRSMK